jgi:hypothetical protein
VPMRETPGYANDTLGLRTLDQAGKLLFISWSGDHLAIPQDGIEVIVRDFLSADVDPKFVLQM